MSLCSLSEKKRNFCYFQKISADEIERVNVHKLSRCKQDRTSAKNFMSRGRVGGRVRLSGRTVAGQRMKGKRSVNKQI